MHLVQRLLPLSDHAGQPFDPGHCARIRQPFTERFSGLTAYTRAPAAGLWQDERQTVRDDVVVYEVMVEELDRECWAGVPGGVAACLQDEPGMRA
ncbi:hypothetical protein DEIPH_ctg025orf0051 [Deinococcus phoenicis]|uniref:Uncharacterized protein n=1 Tax=Deinococcus phoenicis TaxID=1476583 RepID=A0A016QQ65_9DEIO|nr:hypothetical protein [Deinococcus phoenicis]EYB68213.1 hypothetical protein DEIPH_ctg025orf0051 [Deinococcus phoenicis]